MTLDYTWERREEIIRKEEREAGCSEGRREGVNEILLVYNWLKENGRMADAQSIMERGNEEVREKLFQEYEAMRKEQRAKQTYLSFGEFDSLKIKEIN